MKQILLFLTFVFTMVSCTSKKGGASQEETATRSLILFYSQTGTTERVANELQRQTGADIARIEVTQPYDGDFMQTIARCQEEKAQGILPTLVPLTIDLQLYDTIYLGYPVWFGTYAPPIAALVGQYDFAGKSIVPVCTFGSGGLNTSAAQLQQVLPQAKVLTGYGVRTLRVDAAARELDYFLKSQGYVPGSVDPLPAFSEQLPVTDAERQIFDVACSDYQFPLGTPVTTGSRHIPDGTEYNFTAQSTSPDGSTATTTIYIIVPSDADSKPVFTQVVR